MCYGICKCEDCKVRESLQREKINDLIECLSSDIPYNEFERLKMQIISELDKLEKIQKEKGCN